MVMVALMEIGQDASASFAEALELIGGINELNGFDREVLIKVGVFDPRKVQYTTIPMVKAIIDSFDVAPKILLIESDNYRGSGSERLEIWRELFSNRVEPYNLSADTDTQTVVIADEEMELPKILLEQRILVSTHTLRRYSRGSVIKNLFGLLPMVEKAQFHKNLEPVILDVMEAVNGIDLAVLDGTYIYPGPGAGVKRRIPANVFLVGRDAVAVETVGAALMGFDPKKMPIIKMAMERGLGQGDIDQIEVVGLDLEITRTKLQQKR